MKQDNFKKIFINFLTNLKEGKVNDYADFRTVAIFFLLLTFY